MAKVTGVDRVTRRLLALPDTVQREVSAALQAAGEVIKAEAQVSITSGSRSGRPTRGTVRKQYIASAPGEPPTYDTEHLKSGIQVTQPEPLRVLVTSTARYSAALEFGTSKMAARPFMNPAARAKRTEVTMIVRKAVDSAIRRG